MPERRASAAPRAAVTYIGVSPLIDAARADAGCEVMALPGLLFGNRTHLACIVFSPLEVLERRPDGASGDSESPSP